jgi:hypothetical protein
MQEEKRNALAAGDRHVISRTEWGLSYSDLKNFDLNI